MFQGDNEFSNIRVRKRLKVYHTDLDRIYEEFSEATYHRKEELKDQLKALLGTLAGEKERAERFCKTGTEQAMYIPALDEAINFLSKVFDDSVQTPTSGCIYDAMFSIEYYLDDTET